MAAGVTDRLWEMGDVVDMLDAFGAKQKRAARPLFEVCEQNIGAVTTFAPLCRTSAPVQVSTFATEGEAARWIKNESAVWILFKA